MGLFRSKFVSDNYRDQEGNTDSSKNDKANSDCRDSRSHHQYHFEATSIQMIPGPTYPDEYTLNCENATPAQVVGNKLGISVNIIGESEKSTARTRLTGLGLCAAASLSFP